MSCEVINPTAALTDLGRHIACEITTDGIAPKILKETVEQMCTPLAHVFNLSLQEGIVPL